MKLYIGGAYQGKKQYAMKQENVPEQDIADHYHLLIKKQLEEGKDPVTELKKFVEKNPCAVLVADEIGCGIVPCEKEEREYREAVGRTLCEAAEMAEEVWRVVCGCGVKIRG